MDHVSIHVAQETQLQSDQHKVVENDAGITDYPINSYVLYTPPMGRSNKLLPKLEDESSLGKQIKTHVHNLRSFLFSSYRVNPLEGFSEWNLTYLCILLHVSCYPHSYFGISSASFRAWMDSTCNITAHTVLLCTYYSVSLTLFLMLRFHLQHLFAHLFTHCISVHSRTSVYRLVTFTYWLSHLIN